MRRTATARNSAKVNVADLGEVTRTVAAIAEKYGHLDILVNNAGITRDATLMKMEEAQFDQVIDVNLKGVFNCAKAAGAVMAQQKSGAIINTSSVVRSMATLGRPIMSLPKSGIIGMTKVWRARGSGRKGVRVMPSRRALFATEMVLTVPETSSHAEGKDPWAGSVSPKRSPMSISSSLGGSSYINGALIQVDGALYSNHP